MNNDPMQLKSDEEFQNWAGRGLSEWTVRALLANGLDEPERLLFMSEAQIKAIPGIGKASMFDIATYRAKFLR
jgi:hypothetical protein